MEYFIMIIGPIIGVAVGIGIALALAAKRHQHQIEALLAKERAALAIERVGLQQEAQRQAEQSAAQSLEAERQKLSHSLDDERGKLRDERQQLERLEGRLARLEEKLSQREDALATRDRAFDEKLATLDRKTAQLKEREDELSAARDHLETERQGLADERRGIADKLAEVAGLSREEAQQRLLAELDKELQEEQGRLINRRVKEAEEDAKVKARELVSRAIQRYAAEHTAETTTAKVLIPDEEMKGRIIGKEGRNIRAFSQASGVDVIIDDAPGQITLSCFDPVRREIARRALVDLIEDGRIHPARIEEVMARVQQEMERDVLQYGEDAAFTCEVSGLHPQLLKLLGKLQFRTSYGQNVLKHSQEVSFLCGAMAADLGLDPRLGRRCGLLHDIGKAIDHEQEGSHPELGYEALKRYNESEIVANAALAHHEGHEVLSTYTTLAAAADAISAARPGARRENVERYIKRLEQIEDIACAFDGVMKAYAIQAGREVRVLVDGHKLPDDALPKLARSIARRIEDEVAFPGEVRVTTIRETRQSAVAR
ncbi:MAG: ribonuclease Y [Planctomycetota bacterium]|nr:MAG: ribonuclease Y [Planctomycetota bacterium]